MSENKIPTVVIPPHLQAQMDKDPELKAAMTKFMVDAKNAMQGVEDGRYKDFNEGMVALGYEAPTRVEEGEMTCTCGHDMTYHQMEMPDTTSKCDLCDCERFENAP